VASRDPEATKRRILAAALREFSAKGIAGARVDAIAARAKVNKRMLYYYFGSKEGLFREILRRRLHERAPQLQSADLSSPRRLADRQARLLGEGDYTRLLMWEALETKTQRRVDEPSRIAFFRTWVETIEEEQRAGNLPADLDAAQLLLSEIALVFGPMILPQLTRFITGHAVTDPEFERARGEFLEVLMRHVDAPLPTSA
jgi:TetR/AcrR family transcriptional regulator